MERLRIEGVFGAVNAFAVDDEGRFAYLFDPRVDATIRVDLITGTRDVLVWYDRSFHHHRWLCYCMFVKQMAESTYLLTLFYNTKRKQFVLVTFLANFVGKVLHTYTESTINIDCIRLDRLAYNAHVDEDVVQIIFYERFTRHESSSGDLNSPLFYVFCSYSFGSHCTSFYKGRLPQGQWELPFVAYQHLHFISTEQINTQLASIPVSENVDDNDWDIRVVSSDLQSTSPPRKAVWCNAWRGGMGWYVVSQKIIEANETVQKISIWQLDVLDCQWRLLPVSIEVPSIVRNFALRIENNSIAFLHVDWDREGVFYKFDLTELMSKRPDEISVRRKFADSEVIQRWKNNKENLNGTSNATPVSAAEIICPVCLDTYEDPRTMTCGHSICFNCVQKMKSIEQSNIIRCFACRKLTVIPAAGLPVNFSLRDAIETLVKAKQLRLSGLRCMKCRKSCEDKHFWVCLQCASKDDIKMELVEEVANFTDRAKKFSYCAQCILKEHNKHVIDEYCTFRKRCEIAKKVNEKYQEIAEEMLRGLGSSISESVEQFLTKPLRHAVSFEIMNACSAFSRFDEEEISRTAELIIRKFHESATKVSGKLEECIKDLALEHSKLGEAATADRPTEL